MNNQNDLISKSKLLAWLEEQFREYPEEKMGDYGEGQHSFDKVATAVEYGVFDPDPIPLPTLKPGDRVYHERFKSSGTVKRISKSGKRAYVIWNDGYMPSYCDFNSLELMEVQEDVR